MQLRLQAALERRSTEEAGEGSALA
jgi:hypothetical protein